MIYLVLLWFITWGLVRVVKSEPAATIVVVAGMILALILVFGMPHVHG